MHALNMLPKVATVTSNLATYCAFVAARAILRIFRYVRVKLPLSPFCSKHAFIPCKEVSTVVCGEFLLGQVSFKMQTICEFSRACSESFW